MVPMNSTVATWLEFHYPSLQTPNQCWNYKFTGNVLTGKSPPHPVVMVVTSLLSLSMTSHWQLLVFLGAHLSAPCHRWVYKRNAEVGCGGTLVRVRFFSSYLYHPACLRSPITAPQLSLNHPNH